MSAFPRVALLLPTSRSSVAILRCSALALRFAMSDAPRGGHTKNPALAGGRTRGFGLSARGGSNEDFKCCSVCSFHFLVRTIGHVFPNCEFAEQLTSKLSRAGLAGRKHARLCCSRRRRSLTHNRWRRRRWRRSLTHNRRRRWRQSWTRSRRRWTYKCRREFWSSHGWQVSAAGWKRTFVCCRQGLARRLVGWCGSSRR